MLLNNQFLFYEEVMFDSSSDSNDTYKNFVPNNQHNAEEDIDELIDGVLPKIKLGAFLILVLSEYFKTPGEFQSYCIMVSMLKTVTFQAVKDPFIKLVKLFQTCYGPLSTKNQLIAGWSELLDRADELEYATQLYPTEALYLMEQFLEHSKNINAPSAKKRKFLNIPSTDCHDSSTSTSYTTATTSTEAVNAGGIANLASRVLSIASSHGPKSPLPISTTSESILIWEGEDCTIIRKEGQTKGLIVTLRAILEEVVQNKSIETSQYWLHAIWDVKMHMTPKMEEVLEELLTLMQAEMLKDNTHTISKPQKWRNYKSS